MWPWLQDTIMTAALRMRCRKKKLAFNIYTWQTLTFCASLADVLRNLEIYCSHFFRDYKEVNQPLAPKEFPSTGTFSEYVFTENCPQW